jgi:hypothetical protein
VPVPIRRLALALTLCCALLAGSTAWAAGQSTAQHHSTAAVAAAKPSPTTSAQKQRFAKTRFVANAGLAAGAVYEWIVKPYRHGMFKRGAPHHRATLIKAGLAGAFAYNRLKAAVRNAQGDPTLSRALAPLNKGINDLKHLPSELRKGNGASVNDYNNIINKVKHAGAGAGATVHNKVPTTAQLRSGATF